MKWFIVFLSALMLCLTSVSLAFAQTPTVTNESRNENIASGSGVLSSFISGFDWISSDLIFSTPALMESTIKMKDGTELTGMSAFRDIFYDIAVPLFVLITSFVAFSHISNDNSMQLKQFFQRLLIIVTLFILTPAILSYSIQFVNLLNEKIIASNPYNLSTLVTDFLNGFTQIPVFQQLFGATIFLPNWNTIMQLIIFIISIGFLLIGFIYIVFQAVIRFIALLVLSVIFPVVLPFALSGKTENIANTYFKTWFSFLIQQPAFVLGFAIVSALLTSIAQAHNNSIGTLFVYSGALIFLGGINVFIGRIFGEGWSLVTTNAQSMISSRTINRNVQGVARNDNVRRIPSYAGKFAKDTFAKVRTQMDKKMSGTKADKIQATAGIKQKIDNIKTNLQTESKNSSLRGKNNKEINATDKPVHMSQSQSHTKHAKSPTSENSQSDTAKGDQVTKMKKPKVAMRKENTIQPFAIKRSNIETRKYTVPTKRIKRRKVTL